jgi:hypothetical protein
MGFFMVEIKEMPFNEKYAAVLDGMKSEESYAIPFVKEKLGDDKAKELRESWEKQSTPIPENASDQEKYEIAYRNWARNFESAYQLVSSNLGKEGVEELKEAAVEANIRNNAGASLSLLKFIRAISPQTAFKAFAKKMTYKLQVFTPFTVPELTGKRVVFSVDHCKVLDVQGCEEFCTFACQKIYPAWLEKQFKIKMETAVKGKSCTVTLSPL